MRKKIENNFSHEIIRRIIYPADKMRKKNEENFSDEIIRRINYPADKIF